MYVVGMRIGRACAECGARFIFRRDIVLTLLDLFGNHGCCSDECLYHHTVRQISEAIDPTPKD